MRSKLAVLVIFAILTVGSLTVTAAPSSAGSSESAQLGQVIFGGRHQRHHHRRRDSNGSVRYETITERRGHKIFRDTYRITYKNGHEKRKRVERVRVA